MPSVVTAIPPGRRQGSTRQTRFPKYAAWAAPFSPAGPAPITIRSYFAAIREPGSPRLASALARQRPHARRRGIFEQRAAHARRKGADIHHRLPAEVRDLMLGVRRDMQSLSGPDRQMPITQANVAFALKHVYDLLCLRMPMLRIDL